MLILRSFLASACVLGLTPQLLAAPPPAVEAPPVTAASDSAPEEVSPAVAPSPAPAAQSPSPKSPSEPAELASEDAPSPSARAMSPERASPATQENETLAPKLRSPSPPAPAPAIPRGQWLIRYAAARKKLLAGNFEDAETELLHLAELAPSPALAQIAREVGHLAGEFHKDGGVLLSSAEVRSTEVGAKRRGERSTDELAFLYVNTAIYGIGTGIFSGVATESESAAGFVLPMLGVGGAGVLAIALLDGQDALKYGAPQSMTSGMYLGFTQGVLWAAYAATGSELSGATVTGSIWGAATAGIAAGAILGTREGVTPGRASWVGSAGLWTGAISFLGVGAFTQESDGAPALLGAAVGHAAGTIAGLVTAQTVAPSIARVRFLDLGGIAGALVGGGLYLVAAGDDIEGAPFMGLSAAGIATGLVTSALLTRNMDKDLLPSEERERGETAVRMHVSPVSGGGQLGFRGRF